MIVSEIAKVSLFECQYLLESINNGMNTEFRKKDHRYAYLEFMTNHLKRRKYALQDGDEWDKMGV
jgi:hypothetical protein